MTRHLRLVTTLTVLAALTITGYAYGGPPTEQLRVEIDRVVQAVEDPVLRGDGKAAERRRRVRVIADGIFDWSETAKRSLARHWQPLNDAQRDEFVRLFGDLLERAYISKIELYGGEKVLYVAESMDGDQAIVRTKVLTKQGSDLPMDYRMLRRGDRWLVYDVVIEGVSLVSNYRTQFNKIIQTSSYDEVIAKMKAKQADGQFVETAPKRPSRQ
jgi:phospholipid transport system substrate-binding protein